MNLQSQRIAFVGTGQMATALACGFVRQLLKPEQITGCDPFEKARVTFCEKVGEGTSVADSPAAIIANATVVFLSVKPQIMVEALEEIFPLIRKNHLIVSIAAGVTLDALENALPDGTRVVRVMPNTPCLIGRGASGVSRGTAATAEDQQLVTELLSTVGIVETVPEHLLDAVTGLSGSGPAYIMQVIEALSDGGVRMGLPRAIATRLAAQTVAGSGDLVLQTGQHPAVLRDSVTSPGGTTIAGLHTLEEHGVRGAFISAVEAATQRSIELGEAD
ncbi:MAG: pyrroline-5-carboxylate reductase [Planctomycetaceae bacterium]|nr:pyrroline-5-carboxylate reductase [Planctomycetaceae bacterium]